MPGIGKSRYLLIILFMSVLLIQNSLFAQGKFQQLEGDDGLVSMEAENYSYIRESSVETYWEFVEEPVDFSGTDAMQALPAGYNDHKDIVNAQDNAPVLTYEVNFVTGDPVYVWARSSHLDGYDDSVWFGFDEIIEGTAPLSYTTEEQPFTDEWYWISHLMTDNADRAILEVGSPGAHIFQIYFREPSYKIDKIVLTTDEDYIPDENDGKGPPETLVEETSVDRSEKSVPENFELAQNYPNPFNPATTIEYSLYRSDYVTLKIYNLTGEEIAELVNALQSSGDYRITWSAVGLPTGIYLCKLQVGEFSQTRKLLLQK